MDILYTPIWPQEFHIVNVYINYMSCKADKETNLLWFLRLCTELIWSGYADVDGCHMKVWRL